MPTDRVETRPSVGADPLIAAEPAARRYRALRLGGREVKVRPPSIRDPRSHVAMVLLSVQVLGQTTLKFDLSISQILISLGSCALMGVASTWRSERVLAWPASAMLTGNGIALVLRVQGTRHGDWWSLKGWHIFLATCVVAMASKAIFRARGRHVFNPSNLALVVVFLALGSGVVEPLDFWWGPMRWDLALALLLIVAGGTVILSRGHLLSLSLSFWAVFAVALVAMGSVADHCMTARWSLQPICGSGFSRVVAGSPETLLFAMFMVTDPRTIPITRRARRAFGPLAGLVAGVILSFQTTEFAHKVGVLGALAIVFAMVPALERLLDGRGAVAERLHVGRTGPQPSRPSHAAMAVVVLAAMAWSAVAAPGVPSRFVPVTDRRAPSSVGADRPMPKVLVDTSDEVATRIPLNEARQIVRDTLGDLAGLVDAIRAMSPKDAERFADGPWLERARTQIADLKRGRPVELPIYEIDRAIISVARRRGQAAPALMVTLRGSSMTLDALTGELGATRSNAMLSVEVQPSDDGRYLIVTDSLPEGFTPPA